MVVEFVFYNGVSKVVMIDGGDGRWWFDFLKKKIVYFEIIDFIRLLEGEIVVFMLKKMCNGGWGFDVVIECVVGEYFKGLGY